MDYFRSYLNFLSQKKSDLKTITIMKKQNKLQHYSSSNLYYLFFNDNLSKSKEKLIANLDICLQDIKEDLQDTLELYIRNEDGSISLSKNKIK